MKIFGISVFTSSFLVFWLVFFKLTPFICSALPNNSWHKILSIIVYVVVGYFGGIGVPLFLFFAGIVLFLKGIK